MPKNHRSGTNWLPAVANKCLSSTTFNDTQLLSLSAIILVIILQTITAILLASILWHILMVEKVLGFEKRKMKCNDRRARRARRAKREGREEMEGFSKR